MFPNSRDRESRRWADGRPASKGLPVVFERYSESARRCLFFARFEASEVGDRTIAPEHILFGILRQPRGCVAEILSTPPASIGAIRTALETHLTKKEKFSTSIEIPFSPACKQVLDSSAEEANQLGHPDISPEHLLLGLLAEGQSPAANVLTGLGLTRDGVRRALVELRSDPRSPVPADLTPQALLTRIRAMVEASAARDLSHEDRLRIVQEILGAIDELRGRPLT
jgi:ATP-dependent Clp protease ATP-binding subunit ClpC